MPRWAEDLHLRRAKRLDEGIYCNPIADPSYGQCLRTNMAKLRTRIAISNGITPPCRAAYLREYVSLLAVLDLFFFLLVVQDGDLELRLDFGLVRRNEA